MKQWLAGLFLLLSCVYAAAQGGPPQPLPASVLAASNPISASGTSANWAFPSALTAFPAITVHNTSSSVTVYYVLGAASCTATTSGTPLAPGAAITVWTNQPCIAVITGGSSATVNVYQSNGPIQIALIGSGGGGGSSPCSAFGTTAGTCAQGNDSRFPASTALLASNNLSDVANGYTALGNLHVSLTSAKTLTVTNSLTFSGTDASTLNIGAGGTLGSNAFTSTAYAPLASPGLTGVPTAPTATVNTNTTQLATTAFVIGQGYGTGTGNANFGTATGNTSGDVVEMANTTTGVADTGTAFSSLATLTGSQTLTNKTLTSPTLTTPTLGVASATSVNKVTITAPATGSTLTIADGKTLTINNTLALSGTDSSTLNIGAGGTLGSNAYTSTAYAPLASPGLTGTPTAPTAAVNTNTTQLATTAFVIGQGYGTGTGNANFSTATGNTSGDVVQMNSTTTGIADTGTAFTKLCQGTGTSGIIFSTGISTCSVDTNATLNFGTLSLGASGTLGAVKMGNATSGTVTIQPATGALGTVTASLPDNTGVIAEINLAQTFSATQTLADGNSWGSTGVSGLTMLGNIAMGSNNITGGANITSNGIAGYQLASGSCAIASTTVCFTPDRADVAGIGTNGIPGDVSLVAGIASATVIVYVSPTSLFCPGCASASGAETGYLCYGTSNEVFIDSTLCITSLRKFKDIDGPITGNDALTDVMALHPVWGKWNQKMHPTPDTHEQPFLIAEDTQAVDPRLASYLPDGTLHGVRYEEMTAVLVAAVQAQQREIEGLKR
jgi:hypothetical protein